MKKILILSLTGYALAAQAESPDNPCVGIETMAQHQLAFYYTTQDTADKPYWYVKAFKAADNTESGLVHRQILDLG